MPSQMLRFATRRERSVFVCGTTRCWRCAFKYWRARGQAVRGRTRSGRKSGARLAGITPQPGPRKCPSRVQARNSGKGRDHEKARLLRSTFGGYMVVGAEAGNDGRITGLPGVEPQQGYKQTIIQWCTGGATPPFTVEVSDPIPAPAGNGAFVTSSAFQRAILYRTFSTEEADCTSARTSSVAAPNRGSPRSMNSVTS